MQNITFNVMMYLQTCFFAVCASSSLLLLLRLRLSERSERAKLNIIIFHGHICIKKKFFFCFVWLNKPGKRIYTHAHTHMARLKMARDFIDEESIKDQDIKLEVPTCLVKLSELCKRTLKIKFNNKRAHREIIIKS